MKKAAVAYYSKHGSTKLYAEEIARRTGADLFDAGKIKAKDLEDYDIIVFGGGIYSGGIKGLDLIRKNIRKKLADKTILCFAVGITIDSEANRKQCDEINFVKQLEGMKCWYLPGAFRPEEIKGVDRQIINLTKRMIDGAGSEDAKRLMDYFENGCDLVDLSLAAPLAEEVLRLMEEE